MTAVGQAVVLAPGEGRAFPVGRDQVTVKGSTEHQGDGFALVEYTGAAGVPGPPAHLHHTFEEAWYILDGEVDFQIADQTIRGRPGAFLLIPRGVPHAFAVASATPARWIGIFSPARYMQLIEDLGAIMPADGPPDVAKVLEVFAAYDTELVTAAPAP